MEKEKIQIATYRFQSGETLEELLKNQTVWETEEKCLDNMIDSSLREVEDFANESEKELLRKISVIKNSPESDLKLLAIQTDAMSRYMAAKHYDPNLAEMGRRPFSANFVDSYAQDNFPYELPEWMKSSLEEYANKDIHEENAGYADWKEELSDNQIADEKIEQLQANGGMSEAAMEAEISAEEKAQESEIEEDVPYEMPIEVVERSEMLYAGSDKTSGYAYQLRVDDGLRAEIAPELRDLKENEHLFVEYRKWENGEENDYDFSAYIMQENDDGTYSSLEELNTRYNRIRIGHLEESESVNAFKAKIRGFVEGYEERQVKNQEDLSQFDKELSDSSSLEQKTLNEAADLLKNMQFTPENYKKLLNVINEISEMNGLKNLVIPKEEEIVSKKDNHATFKDVVDSVSETKVGETLKTIAEHGAGLPEGSIETAQAVQDKIYEAVHGEPKEEIKNPQEEKIKAEISKLKERMKDAYDSIDEGDVWEYKKHYINIARECEREIEKLEKQLHPDLPEKQETLIQTESEENEQEKSQTQIFDGKSEIVFGETTLPAFSVLVDGKMRSIENAVINGHNKETGSYFVEANGEKIELPKETFNTLYKDKIEQEQQKARLAEGKTIVFEDKEQGIKGTEIPEWSMYTTKGLESFKGFVTQKFNQADNTYILSNGDSTITVSAERFKEITAPERFENKFDENSPAWKKLCEQQYKDFFETRDNTAYNFKHNLSVYCRKEANSPVDALHLAKEIISKMSKEEQKQTKKLLKSIANENETTNDLIARIYHEAVKEQPLNEDYMKSFQPEKVVAWTMPDTVSGNGQKVDNDPELIKGENDRNLRIGMTLKNVDMEIGKVFGKGKDIMHFDELKVISATQEGNSITVMDGNKSYFKLPRDTVLNFYKEQQRREIKQEQKHSRSNTLTLGYA